MISIMVTIVVFNAWFCERKNIVINFYILCHLCISDIWLEFFQHFIWRTSRLWKKQLSMSSGWTNQQWFWITRTRNSTNENQKYYKNFDNIANSYPARKLHQRFRKKYWKLWNRSCSPIHENCDKVWQKIKKKCVLRHIPTSAFWKKVMWLLCQFNQWFWTFW